MVADRKVNDMTCGISRSATGNLYIRFWSREGIHESFSMLLSSVKCQILRPYLTIFAYHVVCRLYRRFRSMRVLAFCIALAQLLLTAQKLGAHHHAKLLWSVERDGVQFRCDSIAVVLSDLVCSEKFSNWRQNGRAWTFPKGETLKQDGDWVLLWFADVPESVWRYWFG